MPLLFQCPDKMAGAFDCYRCGGGRLKSVHVLVPALSAFASGTLA